MQAIEGAVVGSAAKRISISTGMWLAFVTCMGGFGVGLGLTGAEVQTGLVAIGACCVVSAFPRLSLALRDNAKAP